MSKSPDACANITEIRTEIDALDREIVALLGRRFQYVEAAAKFKTSVGDVQAAARFTAMLEARRVWASEEGINPDAIEKLFRDLVSHLIQEEMTRWRELQTTTTPNK